jgi:PAS domain S-box-containing protein
MRAGSWPVCCQRARDSAEGIAILDPAVDCRACPLSAGYDGGAAAVVLLRIGEVELGALGVATPLGLELDLEERSLLLEIAGDLAFALRSGRVTRRRDQYARIVAASPDAMAILDRGHRYLDANPSYGRLVGRSCSELVGQPVGAVLEAELAAAVGQNLDRCFAGEEVRFQLGFPGRERQLIDAVYSPCSDADGAVSAVAVCIRDLTELRAAQLALQSERDNLQAFLTAAPAAILIFNQREELVHANPAAERLFGGSGAQAGRRRCGDLLRCVHRHEDPGGCGSGPACPSCVLYAAIRGVLGSGQAVQDRELEVELEREGEGGIERRSLSALGRGREALDGAALAHELPNAAALEDVGDRIRNALEGTNRIKEITRSLGTFSRVESVDLTPVNLHHAIERAITMAHNEIKYRARLVKDFGRIPAILASEGKLAQVFLNLLINASHAIPEGDVEGNEIRVRTWSEEGEQIVVEVSDTGSGISPEHVDRIFEPFFTTKEVGVGSGLGLAICKNLIESLGGEIGCSSERGKGTRFRIVIPVRNEPVPAEARPVAAAAAPTLRGRILVIDDEPGIRSSLVRILGRAHEVVAAASGEEAREILAADRAFDLIFCDLMMPRVTGMDLHAWLVSESPELAGQMVFITGGAFTPRAREFLARVENLRLEKPLEAKLVTGMASAMVVANRGAQEKRV